MTNRALFLRPASLADLNALVALEKACFAAIDAFQRPALRRLLLSSNTVIVAEDRSGPSPDLIGESIILPHCPRLFDLRGTGCIRPRCCPRPAGGKHGKCA